MLVVYGFLNNARDYVATYDDIGLRLQGYAFRLIEQKKEKAKGEKRKTSPRLGFDKSSIEFDYL